MTRIIFFISSILSLLCANPQKAILLTAFGTSYPQAQISYQQIEQDFRKEFPHAEIRWAYTSEKIRRKLKKRGESKLSPTEALLQLQKDGFQDIFLQSLHVIEAAEYNEITKEAESFSKTHPECQIRVGKPLLTGDPNSHIRLIQALQESLPLEKTANQNLVYMAHGNNKGPGDPIIKAFAKTLHQSNPSLFLAGVEGKRKLEKIIESLQESKKQDLWLSPLMIVAGNHTINDLIGEEKDSWKTILTDKGFHCLPYPKGLGEHAAVRRIFIENTRKGGF